MIKPLIILIVGIFGIATALEAPYVIGDGWTVVPFDGPGYMSTAYFAFSSQNSTLLSFTDTGAIGDTYALFDNGNLIALSSLPCKEVLGGTDTLDPDVAFTTQLGWSKAFVILGSGDHNVTVQWLGPGAVDQGAYIRVDYNYDT